MDDVKIGGNCSSNNDIHYLVIIKFRCNTHADWLKQRALSEYRYTKQRCHAISPFVKCLDFSLGLFNFIFNNIITIIIMWQ